MESIFYRYRNIIVLLIVIFAQLVLLAWQVKSDSDVPMVRVWAVTAVAPVASTIEGLRNGTTGFFSNYFELRNAREQSRQLRTEVERLRLENQLLKNELGSAQRAESLAGFPGAQPFEDDWRARYRGNPGDGNEVRADRSRNAVGRAPRNGGGHAGRHRGYGDRRLSVRQPGPLRDRPGIRGRGRVAEESRSRRTEGPREPAARGSISFPPDRRSKTGKCSSPPGRTGSFRRGCRSEK